MDHLVDRKGEDKHTSRCGSQKSAVSLFLFLLTIFTVLPIEIPEAKTSTPNMIVSGGFSVLYLRASNPLFSLFGEEKMEYVCTDIELFPLGESKEVVLASQGLGPVVFQKNPVSNESACTSPIKGIPDLLLLGKTKQRLRVRVQIGPLRMPKSGNNLAGRLIVTASGSAPIKVPIRVERPPAAPFWTAVTWFLGVVIPGLIMALLAYGGFLLQEQFKASRERAKADKEKKEALEKFRIKNMKTLNQFVEHYRTVSKERDDDKFAEEIHSEILRLKLLDSLPPAEALELIGVLNRGDRQGIINKLAYLLQEWSPKITNPES